MSTMITTSPLEEKVDVVNKQGANPTASYAYKFAAAAFASKYLFLYLTFIF